MKYLATLLLAAGLGLALTAPPASAQPQPKPPSAQAIALAKEILTMKNANAMYSGAVASVVQSVKQTLVGRNLMYQKDLDDVALVVAKSQAGRSNEIGDTMAQIYATDFTEQELKDIVAFYKTPAGQKLLLQEPKSIVASSHFMQAWAARFGEDVNQMFRAEMHKRGKDL